MVAESGGRMQRNVGTTDLRPSGNGGDIEEEERCKEGLERNPRILPHLIAIALDGALLALSRFSQGRRSGSIACRGG